MGAHRGRIHRDRRGGCVRDANRRACAARKNLVGPNELLMEIEWKISERDVALVKTLVQQHSQNSWLLDRERRNLATAKPAVTRNAFWQTMVSMRLTTPQRSGPSSAVAAFNQRQPFPLRY